jgi:hypothetical protein
MSATTFSLAIQCVAALGMFLSALASGTSVLISLRNGRVARGIAMRGEQNAHAIQEIHLTMNSKLSELLRVSAALARAEGIAQGKAEATNDPVAAVTAATALIETAITAKRAATELTAETAEEFPRHLELPK